MKMDEQTFDVSIATKYGLLPAVILKWIGEATPQGKGEKRHFCNGRHWISGGAKSLAEIFPYASDSTISRALRRLEACGLILARNFGENQMDRTKWYALSDKGMKLCGIGDDGMMAEFFSKVWAAYPKKRGKASMTKTNVAKLMKSVGVDQLLRCIDRYLAGRHWHQGDDMTYLKDGSTFFNSGYVDYLDENQTTTPTPTDDRPRRQ